MTMKYLKKPEAPAWDFHIWTPLLEARGDMVPFEPDTSLASGGKVPSGGKCGSEGLDFVEPSVGDLLIEDDPQPPAGPKAEIKVKKKPGPKPGRIKRDSGRASRVGKKATQG